VLESLKPLDVFLLDTPPGDDQHWIRERSAIELFQGREQVLLHAWEERVRGAIEYLDRRYADSERPMPDQQVNRILVVHYQVRALHIVVGKEVPDAVAAIQRATHHVIKAQAGFPILDNLLKAGR